MVVIAKVVPRNRTGTAAATRSSARDLAAYLLGPGDPHRAPAPNRTPARTPLHPPTASDAAVPSQTALAASQPSGSHHVEPRVVAGSASLRPTVLAARCVAADWSDPAAAWQALRGVAHDAVHLLTTALDAGLEHPDRDLLWHTVLAADPADGSLPEATWRAVAARLMAETGMDTGDRATAVPWLAVRHGPNQAGADHVHVMALLLRPDGTSASRNDDFFAAQRAARWAERTYQLTPGRGRTSAHEPRQSGAPSRPVAHGDIAATRRAGPPPRHPGWEEGVWQWTVTMGLNRMWTAQGRAAAAVRSALARSWDSGQLLDLLRDAGYTPRLHRDPDHPDTVIGWSVAGPGAAGRPRPWRGRDLGTDLSWPRIEAHLAALPRPPRGTAGPRGHGPALLAAIAADGPAEDLLPWQRYWLRDTLWQVAAAAEPDRRGPWTDAADLYASVTVERRPPPLPLRPLTDLPAPGPVPAEDLHARCVALAAAARTLLIASPTTANTAAAAWRDEVRTWRAAVTAAAAPTTQRHLLAQVDLRTPARAGLGDSLRR